MRSSRRTWLRLLAAVALAPGLAWGQAYPSKPVKIIVPAQPGGGLDLIGRTIGDQLSRAFDQSFVIENIGGGGGSIACQTTARAAPDGYTLMVGYVATHATSPAVRKVPYDAIKDFTPIAMVGGTRNMLVVHPNVPVSDLKGFIEFAKNKAAKVTFGAGGIGTLNHLLIEQLKVAAGFDAVIVQYKGIGPSFADMLGGQLEAMTPGVAAALPHIRSKKVKPIAVTGLSRHALLPDVPTFEESGFKGFDGVQWYGIVGPAKMRPEIVQRLNAEIGKALAAPALQQRLVAEAIEPMPMTPDEFGRFIQAELARYTQLAKAQNIRLDE
ncbi:MAG TPA: tripartite tricarboxylate transporter substrate binding protein [Burkholderiales bacterium]|nr:tripartite tricarboxylate transporter substrate binding protein [Burkholderiales bacterium]